MSENNDWNNAFHPLRYGYFFNDLNKYYDLKYKVVSSIDEICEEAKKAAKEVHRYLMQVLIGAHGSPSSISIGEKKVFASDLQCLRELLSNTQITLYSCKVASGTNSFAEQLSEKTCKIVNAPSVAVSAGTLKVFNNSIIKPHSTKTHTFIPKDTCAISSELSSTFFKRLLIGYVIAIQMGYFMKGAGFLGRQVLQCKYPDPEQAKFAKQVAYGIQKMGERIGCVEKFRRESLRKMS